MVQNRISTSELGKEKEKSRRKMEKKRGIKKESVRVRVGIEEVKNKVIVSSTNYSCKHGTIKDEQWKSSVLRSIFNSF